MCDCEVPSPVTDHANGDVICCACGVVMEGHILDDTPEWRPDQDDFAASRVGKPGSELGTILDSSAPIRRDLVFRADPQRARDIALGKGVRDVERCVSDIGLSATCAIASVAKELFRDLWLAKGGVRTDARRATAAAAVYFGCKLEGVGRELRLLATVCGVDNRALNSACNEFKVHLHGKAYYPRLFDAFQAGTLIDIFLDRLALGRDTRKSVWRVAHKLDETLVHAMDCGRKPRTVCAGVLWLATQQAGVKATKKDVAKACAVCTQTLDKVVAQIRRCTEC